MCLLFVLSVFSIAGLAIGQIAEPRIVGGIQIPITAAPYQVSIREITRDNIQFGNGFFCGGSLIRNSVVLTAAHCLYDQYGKLFSASQLQVAAGNANIAGRNATTFVSGVASFKVHESYKNELETFENDIAVIRLKTNATITNNGTVQLINLPTSSFPVGASCLISGWGTTTSGSNVIPQYLRGVNVTVYSLSQCNQAQYLNGAVKKGMFCAGSFNGQIDSCQGDSGGPLNCGNFIYGVTSHGYECALPRYPGVYTDVYYYREWILKNSSVTNFISLKILFSTLVVVIVSLFYYL